MSDQPAIDVRTFWFACARGHLAECPLPGDGALLLCDALYVHGDGVLIQDVCGEELRLHGPSVDEWRAAKAEAAEVKAHAEARVAHLERMLGEADAALSSCSTQLDRAMGNEGDWGHRVDVANEAALALAAERDSALSQLADAQHRMGDLQGDVNVYRDAAQKARTEAEGLRESVEIAKAAMRDAVHERDVARREASQEGQLLILLREAVLVEAERLDDRGRHKAANRLREHVTDSYPGGNAPGLCAVAGSITPDAWIEHAGMPRLEALRGCVRFTTERQERIAEDLRAEESLAAELAADPLVSNVEMRRTERGQEEVFYKPKSPEVATIVDGRLVTLLGAPFPEWQAVVHEVMRFGARGTHAGTIPAAIQAMVAEVRELREAERRRKRNGPGGFTVVRDVNQQTEAALTRAESKLADAECDVCTARSVAVWATSALTNVEHSWPEAYSAYVRAIDAEADEL